MGVHVVVCVCCVCQVVSEGCSADVQCCCLSLLHLATEHSMMAGLEFRKHGGMALLQQVMRTPQAAITEQTLQVFFHTGSVASRHLISVLYAAAIPHCTTPSVL